MKLLGFFPPGLYCTIPHIVKRFWGSISRDVPGRSVGPAAELTHETTTSYIDEPGHDLFDMQYSKSYYQQGERATLRERFDSKSEGDDKITK